jgi:hypothetical protein
VNVLLKTLLLILPHGINIVIVNLGMVIMRVKLLMLVNIMSIIGNLLILLYLLILLLLLLARLIVLNVMINTHVINVYKVSPI